MWDANSTAARLIALEDVIVFVTLRALALFMPFEEWNVTRRVRGVHIYVEKTN
jgi:hypothetical protein